MPRRPDDSVERLIVRLLVDERCRSGEKIGHRHRAIRSHLVRLVDVAARLGPGLVQHEHVGKVRASPSDRAEVADLGGKDTLRVSLREEERLVGSESADRRRRHDAGGRAGYRREILELAGRKGNRIAFTDAGGGCVILTSHHRGGEAKGQPDPKAGTVHDHE